MNYADITLTVLPECAPADINIFSIAVTRPWYHDEEMCVKIILTSGVELLVEENLRTVRFAIKRARTSLPD